MNKEKATPENNAIEVAPQKDNTSLAQRSSDYDIDGFLTMRSEFIEKVNRTFVEKRDYHVIQGKKSMAKGGAEKIASIFGWQASFKKDDEALAMFGEMPGTVCFVCTLKKGKTFVGEGRGASTLAKNGGDPNKTLKMAQKSAFIDAVLRTSGLSDFFTQDLEDMNPADISAPQQVSNPQPKGTNSSRPATDKQKELIVKLATEKGVIDNITPDQIDVLTMAKASRWIEKLMSLSAPVKAQKTASPVNNDIPTIEITAEDMPQ